MKRTHSRDSSLEPEDSSLNVHSPVDNCENELFKTTQTEVSTCTLAKDQHLVQSNENIEPLDAETVQCAIDDKVIHEPHCKDGKIFIIYYIFTCHDCNEINTQQFDSC